MKWIGGPVPWVDFLPAMRGIRSDVVGSTFSLADNETKKAKGTSHRHSVK